VDGGMMVTDRTDIYNGVKEARERLAKDAPCITRLKRLAAFLSSALFFDEHFYPILYMVSEKTSLLNSLKGTTMGIEELLPDEAVIMPSSFQVSIGLNQMKKFRENRLRRKRIVERYFEELRHREDGLFSLPPYHPELSHFPLLSEKRDDLASHLLRHGIHATNVFREMPSDLPLLQQFCTRPYPRSRHITDRCVLLPLYAQLSDRQQGYVIDRLLAWSPEDGVKKPFFDVFG